MNAKRAKALRREAQQSAPPGAAAKSYERRDNTLRARYDGDGAVIGHEALPGTIRLGRCVRRAYKMMKRGAQQ